tara:strand:+ start:527 stop:712 length:186 start_codon:yes stop_codon:yes gene_type:complete
MPQLRETEKFEVHGVKCSICAKDKEIKIPIGTLHTHKSFTKKGEYVCRECPKPKKTCSKNI